MQELLFRETIKKHRMDEIMQKYGIVIVGYSGGADSSCLLRLMNRWCRETGVKLYAAHVNHMIRGESADDDERFCRTVCGELGIPFHSLRADVPAIAKECGRGIEETARNVRYEFFDDLAKQLTGKTDGAAVVTAHNAGDNLETVIFNMLRGTGTHGLCGIDPIRDGRFLRPLIADDGESIRLWCYENGVEYVTDATNADTEYTRNHIRHNIVAEMKKICQSPENAAVRMTELVRQDDDYINSVAAAYVKDNAVSATRADLAELHPAVSSRVLRMLYNNAKSDGSTLGEVHVRGLTDLINSSSAYAELSLPGKITARIDRHTVRFSADGPETEPQAAEGGVVFSYPADGDRFENRLYRMTFSLCKHNHHTNNHNKDENIYKLSILTTLCFDKIKGELKIKYREAGDTYRFGGMTRKVKKLLSEKKLSRDERTLLPILCDDDGIVWIPGFPPRDGTKYSGEENSLQVACDLKDNL